MTKQELINLTNLENFADEFDKVESYVDSYLKTQLPNNYDDLKKHIKELRKMLVQLENNRAEGLKHLAFIGDSDDIPNKKAKLLKQMYLNKIDELEIDLDKSVLKAPFAGKISQRYLDQGTTKKKIIQKNMLNLI